MHNQNVLWRLCRGWKRLDEEMVIERRGRVLVDRDFNQANCAKHVSK
jgi:hypothetical protein